VYLYDRVGEVTLGRPGMVGQVYAGLNFTFDLRKTLTPEVNPGVLKIYNLASTTRRSIHELETVCVVKVGYAEALGPVEIFRGYVTQSSTPREGPDLVTTLELRDGYQELVAGKFNKSYAKDVNLRTIISDVIGTLKLPLALQNRLTTIASKKLTRGWAFNGKATDALDELAKLAGVAWSVQSGQVKLLAERETDQRLAVVLTPTTGLLGRPTRISDVDSAATASGVKKKKIIGWRLESLLLPTVEPGNSVSVVSDEVTGVFKVVNVAHDGELMGARWHTTLEVMEI
jgi:hypothetical protein